LNENVIYVSVSGFGPKGPYATRAAFDEVLQAMSGLMALTGPVDGLPTTIGVPIIDTLTGVYTFGATLAALYHRLQTGRGQSVEANLFGAALVASNPSITRFFADGVEESRNGNRNRYVAGVNTYRTKDGYVHFVAYSDSHWSRLASRIGPEALVEDDRYKTIEHRTERIDEVDALISSWTTRHVTSEIVAFMEADGIPCGEVRSIGMVASDPELRTAGRIVDLDHPNGAALPFLAMPLDFSETPQSVRLPPPRVGEHSRSVLSDYAGLSQDEVASLINRGVVGIAD
jgi:CoA:oxalate CoA-transferase